MGESSSLKPRYLFIYHDAVFVMKQHDQTDTNTRRYRILARLALVDLTVDEVGDDMFDLVCTNAGAMRYKVGTNVTRAQVVSLLREAIEKRRARHAPTTTIADDLPTPQNPDDVYEAMNYALAVLEKKMRGKASEKEQWQVDQLLKHALSMQDRQHGERTVASVSGNRTITGPTGNDLVAQLKAKEAQLRAMEDRAATAEAALSRFRGTAELEDSGHRSLVAENRMLRVNADRLTALVEEKEKLLSSLREEVSALRTSSAPVDGSRRVYDKGTVDEVLENIRRPAPVQEHTPSAEEQERLRREREDALRREQEDKAARAVAEQERSARSDVPTPSAHDTWDLTLDSRDNTVPSGVLSREVRAVAQMRESLPPSAPPTITVSGAAAKTKEESSYSEEVEYVEEEETVTEEPPATVVTKPAPLDRSLTPASRTMEQLLSVAVPKSPSNKSEEKSETLSSDDDLSLSESPLEKFLVSGGSFARCRVLSF